MHPEASSSFSDFRERFRRALGTCLQTGQITLFRKAEIMRTNKKLAVETLERREVFSVAPGFEGLTPDTQVTDQDIALKNGTQLTSDALVVHESGFDGWLDELAAVDQLFAEYQVTARPAVAGSRFASPQAGSSFRPNEILTFDGPQFDDIRN